MQKLLVETRSGRRAEQSLLSCFHHILSPSSSPCVSNQINKDESCASSRSHRAALALPLFSRLHAAPPPAPLPPRAGRSRLPRGSGARRRSLRLCLRRGAGSRRRDRIRDGVHGPAPPPHPSPARGERSGESLHERPLSKSGRADAISVSDKLQEMGWIPELVLCSDATRTKETLKILQEHVQGLSEAVVHFIPSFYSIAAMDGQTAEHLQKAICEYCSDDILTVMCMGHNKGWEEAASMFSGNSVVLKTCNAALLEAVGKSWVEAFSLAGLGGWKLHGIVKP
ncbi:hypothetical protein PR202_ga16875 [Eleusine coracana subsp. coracana]|uniref:Uncharacterized protein n=1 Tax=Eleusine coracana subsp. coracana TaxID=191504 RepID=A0AAV5CMN7_ELECO|nr:hypothetical protein PR202_ga16875 [Eleusine coracana subsp. coracana]